MQASSNGVAFNNVDFAYQDNQVLKGFSLEVKAGSFTALLGVNGSGKSTLFNLASGLLVPEKGSVCVGGFDTVRNRVAAAKNVGKVFQQAALDMDLTVQQNLRYYIGIYGLKSYEKHLDKLLHGLALKEFLHRKCRELSGGYRRRVEIVQAMLPAPQILLLDEPTVGLDPVSKNLITDYAHDLVNQGVTVIWITHLLDELRDKDHVVMIRAGQCIAQSDFVSLGAVEGIMSHYNAHENRKKTARRMSL